MKEKLPVVSGSKLVKVLVKKFGYHVHDQKESHIHLRHSEKQALTVPNHKVVSKGVLKEVIKFLGVSKKDFMKLLKEV